MTNSKRINRILKSHCFTEKGELLRGEADEYGDVVFLEKYGEYPVYFSRHLHRYNPYVGFKVSSLAAGSARSSPMAILPYTEPIDIRTGDILRLYTGEFTVSFCEDVRGCYYLLSLAERGR